MKLELKIEAPGVQVYAYEIDAATKELLKENKENEANGLNYREPIEIVEEHAKVTLISHGIAPRNEGCKYTAIIDGEEKAFFPCMFEYTEMEDFENSDYIEMAITDYGFPYGSPDNVDADDCVWKPIGDDDFQHLGAKEAIAEGHTVIFEVIPYSSGTLHTSFEVANDFKLRDLKLIIDNPDTNEEYDLSWLYYCNVFDGILGQNRDKPFDEDTIRGVDYKGERHDFHLDFQGGSGWYEAHEKGEDGWFPSYLVNDWLSEG